MKPYSTEAGTATEIVRRRRHATEPFVEVFKAVAGDWFYRYSEGWPVIGRAGNQGWASARAAAHAAHLVYPTAHVYVFRYV